MNEGITNKVVEEFKKECNRMQEGEVIVDGNTVRCHVDIGYKDGSIELDTEEGEVKYFSGNIQGSIDTEKGDHGKSIFVGRNNHAGLGDELEVSVTTWETPNKKTEESTVVLKGY